MRKIIFIILVLSNFSVLFSQNFSDSILIDDIKHKYEHMNEKEIPYTVSLVFRLNKYRADSPVTMQIVVHAKRDNVSFTNTINQFENYSFHVFDENNNIVANSDTYTLWSYRGLDYMQGDNVNVVTLNQGETFSRTIDLNNWFDLKKLGRYRIEGNFFPMPHISQMAVKTQTAYFIIDRPIEENTQVQRNESVLASDIPYTTPSTNPPYSIISDMLSALSAKDWDRYFANMFMPSIIMVSQRYSQRYVDIYGQNIENLSDSGIQDISREFNLNDFLKSKLGNAVTLESMQRDFGGNFVRNMEKAYSDRSIRTLAILYELNYRLSLPSEKKEIFDEYKNYLASAYDANLRRAFVYNIERKSLIETNLEKREYYKNLLEMMRAEYNSDTVFQLNSFEIVKTTIEEQYGLETAIVETKLYEKYTDPKTRTIYSPIINRVFTLRKMGDYWYVVDYYDNVLKK